MEKARKHASAASYGMGTEPIESLSMAILMEHEKENEELRKKVYDLS